MKGRVYGRIKGVVAGRKYCIFNPLENRTGGRCYLDRSGSICDDDDADRIGLVSIGLDDLFRS